MYRIIVCRYSFCF